ncbi:MAG: LacI family DNA-binding transcriptional regulator [Bacteroidetes bacterium]|nr:LacI family DNA-binding transcriptional regulator [Bacteroidota bacterium]
MKKKITIKLLATELGVSISTVSKSLHNSPEISKETREKVQAFAKHYNYRPNNIALSLKNKKTKTIGVIIPEVVHHFFAMVVRGVEQVAMERGYNVLISLSNESFEKEVINMETFADSLIGGFILSLSKETLKKQDYHHIHQTIEEGMPVVLFDRTVPEISCDKVVVNDEQGAQLATEHLLAQGRKHILLITTEDYIIVGRLRTQGYVKALQKANIPLDNGLIIKTEDTQRSDIILPVLEDELRTTLKAFPHIDAIFAVNEIYAAAAMRVIREYHLIVPDDIALVCFNDGVISKYAVPPLTTVNQHGTQIGIEAANLLIDRLESEELEIEPITKVVACEIVKRHST